MPKMITGKNGEKQKKEKKETIEKGKGEKGTQATSSQGEDSTQATSSQGNLGLQACKWAMCSTTTNHEMLSTLTAATLYQEYVCRSSAHEHLHVVFHKGVFTLYALKQMNPGDLLLLPFGDLIDPGVASPGCAPVMLQIPGGGEKEFRLRAKNPPRSLGTSGKAVVLIPFWVLSKSSVAVASKSSAAVAPNLVYQTQTISVQRSEEVKNTCGEAKGSIVIKTVCMTNDGVVPKGAPLVAKGKLPAKLE